MAIEIGSGIIIGPGIIIGDVTSLDVIPGGSVAIISEPDELLLITESGEIIINE